MGIVINAIYVNLIQTWESGPPEKFFARPLALYKPLEQYQHSPPKTISTKSN